MQNRDRLGKLALTIPGIINKISEAQGAKTENQLSLTSKALAKTVQTNPLTIKSGGYLFNKRLFEKLTVFEARQSVVG